MALLGAVLTRQRLQSTTAQIIEELTTEIFGSRIFKTKIPERQAIANSIGNGRPLVFTAAAEANCFFGLAEELEALIHAPR